MDFTIVTDPDGSHHATNGMVALSVLPEIPEPNLFSSHAKIYRRRALKRPMTPDVHKVSWIVGEIDGVKCYVKQDGLRLHIVLTRQELYP